jgi:hypothetical protein
MMVDASEPPLDIHNVYVQLRKVFAFVRRDLGKFRIILLQWFIAIPLIRYNFSVLAYPSFKEWTKRLGRSIVNNLGIRATKAFIDNLKGNDDKAFVLTSSSEHPFLCTANEELVYMDFSRKWIVSRTLHRLLYFPFKFPAGLLTEFIFSDSSSEDIPFFLVLILKAMWKASRIENLHLSNMVPAVGLSSYLHLVHLREYGSLPLQ